MFNNRGVEQMKISEFFYITKFGGVIAAGVLAAAITFIIQLGLSYNNKLVKLEVEQMHLSKENNKEFGKDYEEFGKIISKLDNPAKMLGELQPLLEHFSELEQRIEENENDIDRFEKTTEYLKGQVETILSYK